MDLDRFLNLLTAVFGALGSIYVLKGIAALSPDLVERLSRSYWGFSIAQVDSLTGQRADSLVGMALVIVALALAVVNSAAIPAGVRFVERRGVAVALTAALAGVAYVVLALAGDAIQRHDKRAVVRMITSQALQELFRTKRLPASEIESLRVYTRALEMQVEDSESPRSLLDRLAANVGLQVPRDLDYSEVEKKPEHP